MQGLAEAVLVSAGGVIEHVGCLKDLHVPSGTKEVDLQGAWLIPVGFRGCLDS